MGVIFPGSSMVEQEAVNFEVAGSSPAPGARSNEEVPLGTYLFDLICICPIPNTSKIW